jgi:hypothetical protein
MTRALLLAVGLAASPALAQTRGLPTRDKEAVQIREVERGIHLGVAGGLSAYVNPPASAGPRPFSMGQAVRVEAGVDLGERLAVSAYVQGMANRAGADYQGFSNRAASGDFTTLVVGGTVRGYLFGLLDAQEVKRTWIYLRGGAGYALFSPRTLIDRSDVMIFGGGGIDYFTKLRHFSVGVELTGSYLLASGTVGFGLTPHLRYAF